MTRQDEIKALRKDIRLLIAAVVNIETLKTFAEKNANHLADELSISQMSQTVHEASADSIAVMSRTIHEYQRTQDYLERRVAVLLKLDREEKYGRVETKTTPDKYSKAKKVRKQKVEVFFDDGASKNRFKVYVAGEYVGEVRRSKDKYQSGTEIRFTEEALTTRKLVKDGKLNTEEVARFSQTRFRSWKFGTDERRFKDYKEAAAALIMAKKPEIKSFIIK